MKHTELRKTWERRIADFKKSGEKNKSAWSRKKGISARAFCRWYRELENNDAAAARSAEADVAVGVFIPVVRKEIRTSSLIHIKIGCVTVEVNEDTTSEHLAEVLKVVSTLC